MYKSVRITLLFMLFTLYTCSLQALRVDSQLVENIVCFDSAEKKDFFISVYNDKDTLCDLKVRIGRISCDENGAFQQTPFESEEMCPIKVISDLHNLPGRKKTNLVFQIDMSKIDKEKGLNPFYVAVSEDEKNQNIEGEERIKIQFKYEYLVQVYVKTKKSPTGDLQLTDTFIDKNELILKLHNPTKNMLTSSVYVNFFSDKQVLPSSPSTFVRILPGLSRTIKFALPEDSFSKFEVLVDDPSFNFFLKEIAYNDLKIVQEMQDIAAKKTENVIAPEEVDNALHKDSIAENSTTKGKKL